MQHVVVTGYHIAEGEDTVGDKHRVVTDGFTKGATRRWRRYDPLSGS